MSNRTLPVNTFVVPLALTGLIASASMPAAARQNDADQLARLAQRQARIQIREDRRNARVNTLSVDPIPPTAATRPLSVPIEMRDTPYQNILHNSSSPSVSQNLHNRSQVLTNAGKLQNVSGGAELDLTSDSRSIKLGENLFDNGNSVSITVGGEEKTLTAGVFVTPAEYVAVTQKLAGNQGLVLASKGNAVGGDVLLSILSDAGRKIEATSLVVPEKVQAIGNFADKGDFRLTGQLNNFGSVVALSTNNSATEAKIGARSIYNAESGVITSVGANTLASRFGPLNTSLDLNLDATDSFINLGNVSSAGNLTISSAQVVNAGGTMSAQGHVNLNSANIDNYGTIFAHSGNVNIDSALPAALSVTNDGGKIQALNGAINIRTAYFVDKLDTSLTGGDWLSQKLNINGGDGVVNVKVGQLTGGVNAHAGSAFIEADTDNLTIEEVTTTGDPIMKNTGNIPLGNVTTNGAPLAVIAGGSITAIANTIIDTSNGAGAGGSILLAAGVTYEDPNGSHPNETWITGSTSTGGDVGLNACLITSDGTTSAGNIIIVAFPGELFAAGNVLVGSISAEGGTGANGNVTVIGRSAGMFSISNNTGTVGTGNAFVSSFNPVIVGGVVKIADTGVPATSGGIISGSFDAADTTADPDSSDSFIVNSDVGGTLTIESPDDVVIQGDLSARSVNILGTEATQFLDNTSITALNGINILSRGISNDISHGHVFIDDTTIGDLSTTNGDITITQERGKLIINPGASVAANEGNLKIQHLNTLGKGGKKYDAIEIGDNAQLTALASTAGLGNVTISTGVVPNPAIVGKPFKGVSFDIQAGGAINWGRKISPSKDGNISVTAKGAIVTFSNALSKKAVKIGTGVDIIGDPPGLPLPTLATATDTDVSTKIPAPNPQSVPSAPAQSTPVDSNGVALQVPTGNLLSTDAISKFATVATSITNTTASTGLSNEAIVDTGTAHGVAAYVWSDHDMQLPNSKMLSPKLQGSRGGIESGSARQTETASLKQGRILFAPDSATQLLTPYGNVEIDAGSMALVVVDSNALGVYDFHDGKKGSVRVNVDGKTLHLSPGHCTVVSEKSGQFCDVNPVETIGYGKLNEIVSDAGKRVYTAEFSTVHAAAAVLPLQEIMRSSHPEARKLAAKFLKTSAVLMHLGQQEFQLHPKAAMTAWKM